MQPEQLPQTPLGQQPVPPAQQDISPSGTPSVTSTNRLAIAGLVLVLFFPPIGLVLSVVALRQIKNTSKGGRKIAIAGIVLNTLAIALVALMISSIVLTTNKATQELGSKSSSQSTKADEAEHQAVPVADEYVAAIIAKDGTAAYPLLTTEAQSKYTAVELTNGFSTYRISGVKSFSKVTATISPDGVATGVIVVYGYNDSSPKYLVLSLKNVDNNWLVSEAGGTDTRPSN